MCLWLSKLKKPNARKKAANLNFDPEHSFAQPLQAWCSSSESVPEVFVGRRVADQLPRVVEEQDLEVVLQRVADEDSALEEIAHLLLNNFEILAWNKIRVEAVRTTSSGPDGRQGLTEGQMS